MLQSIICWLAATTPAVQGLPDVPPGSLHIVDKGGKVQGLCPLERTRVEAQIAGFGARVVVKQSFRNPSKEPIEAVYTFPLPADGAVDAMNMKLGDRLVQGEIKRRDEARRIYDAAKQAGMAAALLDQERPNIFTQSVANILPGSRVEIEISYVQLLKYEEGEFEFTFPMVVGPRFTGVTPDPGKVTPPITPKGTRTGAGIDLQVRIEAGAPITSLNSELHDVTILGSGSSHGATVTLAKKDEIPNRDFILRYGVASESVQSALLTYADPHNGGFFTLILMPPKAPKPSQIVPRELIFVFDQSGSQSGFPITKSKELTQKMISAMRPEDSFNVMGFSNTLNPLWQEPRANTPENRAEAQKFVAGLEARGGTMLNMAINAAMQPKPDPRRVRIIVFNTDGFVGDEYNILDSIQKQRGAARIFTFGIGNSVNRFLIDSMSAEGRGDAEYVTLAADTDKAVDRFIKRTQSPVLTDIRASFEGVSVADVLPLAIPDVFSETPVILKGRYTQPGPGTITVTGILGDTPWRKEIEVNFPDTPTYASLIDDLRGEGGLDANLAPQSVERPSNLQDAFGSKGSAIATLWARSMIDEVSRSNWLAMYSNLEPDKRSDKNRYTIQAVTNLGLRFGLMTAYTSFVAVEKRVINIGGKQRTVAVPVEMADGVSYEGIFGQSAEGGKAMSRVMAVPSVGGGGFGGGGLGGYAGAAPPAAQGLFRGGRPATGDQSGTKLGIDFVSYDPTDNSIVVRDEGKVTKKKFDEMTDQEIEKVARSIDGEAEKNFLKPLKPAQIERYFYVKRLDSRLRTAQDSLYLVQVWIAEVKPEFVSALRAAGLREAQSQSSLKAVFGSANRAGLKKIAALPFVKRVLPLEG